MTGAELGFLLSVLVAACLGWTLRRICEDRQARRRAEAWWRGERI
jgi:hypothetical protein